LTREDKTSLRLGNYVSNFQDAVAARIHMHREWALKWVLAPILFVTILPCVTLMVLDAIGRIAPMRADLLSLVKTVMSVGVGGSSFGAGFGWLFNKEDTQNE
jgi:hypothetical protein